MKAITCSQCGALIKGISTIKEFVACIYCGAEIPIRQEKVFEVSDKKNEEAEKRRLLQEKLKTMQQIEHDEWSEKLARDYNWDNKRIIIGLIFLVIIIIAPFLLYHFFNR